jgi:hypothetical protein
MPPRTTNTTSSRGLTSKEYTQLKRELDELKDSVEEQNDTLKKIHSAIVGDKDFGQEGLVGMVRRHDKWIEAQKFMWAKIYGGIIVGSAFVSVIWKIIFK